MDEIKFRNYYEATLWFYNTTDSLIGSTIGAIYRAMNTPEIHELKPRYPFDMLFFYVVSVNCMSKHFGHTILDPLPNYSPTCCVDVPDLNGGIWLNSTFVQSRVASTFLEVVRQESSLKGDLFDVQYACSILYYAIDKNVVPDGEKSTLDWINENKGLDHKSIQRIQEDDELWLLSN